MLLYWHDAFDSVIWLSATLEETRVMAFAKKFGLEARLVELHKIDDVAS
jgi:hypothetical protein